MLTHQQATLLRYLEDNLSETGVCPSYEEMCQALGLKSKSGIHRLVSGLEERGYVRRLPNKARSLEILRGVTGGHAAMTKNAANDSDQPDTALISAATTAHSIAQALVEVPIQGRIAAGVPIEAIQQRGDTIALSPALLGGSSTAVGDYFALAVQGDSMIDAGIFDGDLAIIRAQTTAMRGEIVVALIDQEEATLKTYEPKDGKVVLRAANDAYEDRAVAPDRLMIQGVLATVVRRYS